MSFVVERLVTGGILTNYNCTSRCASCRHGASPERKTGFIAPDLLADVLAKLHEHGCKSVHIEGGEPFLYPNELAEAVKIIKNSPIDLEHIVTNAGWYRNMADAQLLLSDLKQNGLRRLLIKIGPFQNEFVALNKVTNVIKVAEKLGINIILWDSEIYPEVAGLDTTKTHTLKQYQQKYGDDYVRKVAQNYSLAFTGRTFKAFEPYFKPLSAKQILDQNPICSRNFPTESHFHVDRFGNFLFSHTQGVAIHYTDIGKPIAKEKYPILHTLIHDGIKGSYKLAVSQYGYKPRENYISKCHLCFDIRQHLVKNCGLNTPDLQPVGFYS